MKSLDDHTQSFIVRFWLEPRELVGKKPVWRGMVEHVPTGRRLYLEDPEVITEFIASYLPGVSVSSRRD